MASTVSERLAAIAESDWPIAFDGCHKIYFLDTPDREKQAIEFGYDIFKSSEVRGLYRESPCGLRFVERWPLSNDPEDWKHPLNIHQFEED